MQETQTALDKARLLQQELIAMRRHLHAHPELSFEEHETASFLAERLAGLGYKVRTGVGKTGVTGDLGTGKAVAIRAELDAFPIMELNRLAYSSTVAGISHACGHDANMACAMGAARLLAEDLPAGGVRIIMQPAAEESCDESGRTGTIRMIEDGALEDVSAIITLHVDATLPVGKVGIILEPPAVSLSLFTATLMRDEKVEDEPQDLVLAGARLIQDLYERGDSLGVSPGGKAISVASVESSSTHADVPSTSLIIQGSFKSYGKDSRKAAMAAIETACANAQSGGLQCAVKFGAGREAHPDSPEIAETMRQAAIELLGEQNVIVLKRKTWTEDFATFTEKVPGALVLLGTEIVPNRRTAHSATFDIEESPLYIGAALLAHTARRLLQS